MAFKVFFTITIAVALNLVNAAIVPVAPAAPVLAKIEDFDAVPQYSYAYDVQDALTGDSKAQYETRNGDIVQGSYSLIEADGTRRIVDYTADSINGFNAVVNREPAVGVTSFVAKTAVAPVAVAAPVAARTVLPAAPIAPVAAVGAPFVGAPVAARTVLPAAPVAPAPYYAARNIAAPFVASPYYAGNIAAPVPVASPAYAARVAAYTIPRAVATRLSPPFYNAPLNYAVAPTTVF